MQPYRKAVTKSLRKDNGKHTAKMISEDVDERDIFMGLRNLRRPFVPIPLGMKDAQSHHVPFNKRAAEAAKYFGTAIWGTPPIPAPPPGGQWKTNEIIESKSGIEIIESERVILGRKQTKT